MRGEEESLLGIGRSLLTATSRSRDEVYFTRRTPFSPAALISLDTSAQRCSDNRSASSYPNPLSLSLASDMTFRVCFHALFQIFD